MRLPSCTEGDRYDRELDYAIELHIAAHGEARSGCPFVRGGEICNPMLPGPTLSRLAWRVRERRRLRLVLGCDFIPIHELPGSDWAHWRLIDAD